ncbi:MAG: hypothetical protein ABS46_10520 [Cytophagaceae bacterium SCN 52-12]|nr:MAG: hypothetical protein ABS46_10520 [Cytophagaceae bacterium SCN 52-12]
MKKARPDRSLHPVIFLFITALGIGRAVTSPAQENDSLAVKRCATMKAYHFGLKRLPFAADPLQAVNEKITSHIENKRKLRMADSDVIRIPVVVHVIHDRESGSIGGRGNPNISEEQIRSQIRILNEDYRRVQGTPGYNENPVGVDTEIEFFLAEFTPDGAQSDGITRNYYKAKTQFNPYTDAATLAGIVSWPADQYLNIWVCTLSGNYLGVAQFPSLSGVPGLDNADADKALTDGVIIDYRSFGDVGALENANYNQGRTTTHEVGHWLGLLHIWGDARCGDDYCADTPWAETSNSTSCNEVFSSCRGTATRNMIENYMDYSPDRCMNVFTFNQMERMHAVLELSPRRAALVENSRKARLEESAGLLVSVYPNPVADGQLKAEIRYKGYQDINLAIIDMNGRKVGSSSYRKVWSRIFTEYVGNLSRGIYLLVVTNENGEKASRRFIVN